MSYHLAPPQDPASKFLVLFLRHAAIITPAIRAFFDRFPARRRVKTRVW